MDSFIHQKFEFLLGTCHSLGPGKGAENRLYVSASRELLHSRGDCQKQVKKDM